MSTLIIERVERDDDGTDTLCFLTWKFGIQDHPQFVAERGRNWVRLTREGRRELAKNNGLKVSHATIGRAHTRKRATSPGSAVPNELIITVPGKISKV